MACNNGNPVLDLVDTLCNELRREAINYCHWKSNAALDRSASGKNDLDLLVDRADSQAFLRILYHLGFKETQSPTDFVMPGIHNYYGYDKSADVFVNVHAHYKLMLGHDFTKNFHIPIERAYLNSSVQGDLFRVPAPEFECVIFVLRMVIKHFTWDALLLRHEKLSSSEKNELDYLMRRVSESGMDEVLTNHLSCIDLGVFHACLKMMDSNVPIVKRVRIGQKLMHYLEPYSRKANIIDAGLKGLRRIAWPVKRRLFRAELRKRMNNGGLLVAIVGGDGAGKTTVVEGIVKWLGDDFSVRKFHMGKPDWSLLTILIRGMIKIGRMIGLYPFQRAEIQYTNEADLLVFPGYPWLMRELCTARDRYLTYKKARRFATNGGVVVLDRFPLPQIKFMDGPQIARMTRGIQRSPLMEQLIQMEDDYYNKMTPPDMLIVLRVDPQIAVQRKTDEAEKDVRSRSTEIWALDWDQTPGIVIDASHAKEMVLAEVKALIWSWL